MIIIISMVIKMSLLRTIEKDKNLRKIFGERELVIIRKQLLGVPLIPSEKTRLSRDIKKKFEAIKSLAPFLENNLKKGVMIKEIINETIDVIKEDLLFRKIKKIMLFGSTVENQRTFRSDIDIAVEFNKINIREATKFRIRISGKLPDRADIQVFNVLPNKIKKSILKKHKVLYERENK